MTRPRRVGTDLPDDRRRCGSSIAAPVYDPQIKITYTASGLSVGRKMDYNRLGRKKFEVFGERT